LKNGESVILFDGSGFDFESEILSGNEGDMEGKKSSNRKDSISFRIMQSERSRYMPDRKVSLFCAITKKDTFEWIVEKATELGVSEIIPVLAERSEKKSLNMERLNKIAIEASEQSGRGDVPVVASIKGLSEVLSEKLEAAGGFFTEKGGSNFSSENSCDLKFFALHTEGDSFEKCGGSLASSCGVNVFIGPEGGWSPDEVSMFHKHKIPVVSLGKQVFRAETAVIVALSKVL
jgi:16S rRNA (uracil1498-N3)-methyltransferase